MPNSTNHFRTLPCLVALASALLLALPSCGGGSGKSSEPIQTTLTFVAEPTVTGYISELTPGSLYMVVPDDVPKAGDDGSNNPIRGFVRFDISSLPQGTRIITADLVMTQGPALGTPYASLGGTLKLDHVELGTNLDDADWQANSLSIDFATLSMDASLGTRTVPVGQQVALDVASQRATTDFRFYFPTPFSLNTMADQAIFVKPGQLTQPRLELFVEIPQ